MLFKFTDESYSVASIYASLAWLLCFIFHQFDYVGTWSGSILASRDPGFPSAK